MVLSDPAVTWIKPQSVNPYINTFNDSCRSTSRKKEKKEVILGDPYVRLKELSLNYIEARKDLKR